VVQEDPYGKFRVDILGNGLTTLGINSKEDHLTGVISTFGEPRTESFNEYFAQVVVEPGLSGTQTVRFALAGVQVLEIVTGSFGVPEPTSFTLASLGNLSSVASHRRRENRGVLHQSLRD